MSKCKCYICDQYVEKGQETIPFKGNIAHLVCFNKFVKAVAKEKNIQSEQKKAEKNNKTVVKKSKAELKDALSEQEYEEKQNLFRKIRDIQCAEEITAKTYKLVSDYMEKYNFTFKGISRSLEYFYHIQGNVPSNDCIGIIPYIYYEAQEFYALGEKTLMDNVDVDLNKISDMYQIKIIKITPKVYDTKLIDIESIGED